MRGNPPGTSRAGICIISFQDLAIVFGCCSVRVCIVCVVQHRAAHISPMEREGVIADGDGRLALRWYFVRSRVVADETGPSCGCSSRLLAAMMQRLWNSVDTESLEVMLWPSQRAHYSNWPMCANTLHANTGVVQLCHPMTRAKLQQFCVFPLPSVVRRWQFTSAVQNHTLLRAKATAVFK